MPSGVFDLTINTVALEVGVLFGSIGVRDLLKVGTIPSGSGVENVFVIGVEVVGRTFVMALNDVDVDELGVVFGGLGRAFVVSAVDVRGVAVVVRVPREASGGGAGVEDAGKGGDGGAAHLGRGLEDGKEVKVESVDEVDHLVSQKRWLYMLFYHHLIDCFP